MMRQEPAAMRDFNPLFSGVGHDRSFGDVSSMSGLRESGHRLGDL
jgi:hypothetical protein